MKRLFILLFILTILLSPKISFADTWADFEITSIKGDLPEMWVSAFDENSKVMGENYLSFKHAFQQLDTIDEKKAGIFLVAFMPLVDLVAMDTETFVNNITYAIKAREEFPWTKEYDDEIFYHYVLPHRVSQEPIEDFRPFFYDQLKDRLKGITTLNEAAVEVNKYSDELVDFKPTQWRDQGPFETLKSGYGRCEEMMIFYIDAARSVGIPARQAWTPYWAHSDNNHAWVEVYAFGRWNFLGACEYANQLDEAWFKNPAKRAALVKSVPYGLPDKESITEEIYYYADESPEKFAIINSTRFYTTPGMLEVTVVDGDENPLSDVNVFVYVFNFGVLRPIAKLKTDDNGIMKLTIGEGRYYVSAGTETDGTGKLFNIKKNQTTEILLNITEGTGLKEFNWVRPAKQQ